MGPVLPGIPHTHPCQTPAKPHQRLRGVCRFPAPIQCSCDSQPWQMLMTKGDGVCSDAASSPHWKQRCCSLHV